VSSRSRRPRALVSAVTLVLSAALAAPAAAQSTPPTTANPLEQLVDNLLGATTTVPPAPGAPPAPAGPDGSGDPGTGTAPAPPAAVADGAPTPEESRVIPPEAQAVINSISRTGGRNTNALMNALGQLVDLGLSPEEAAVIGMGKFPVAGEAAYNDDFLTARFGPGPGVRFHQGNDIFAARGTPLRAPEDGTVRFSEDPTSGKAYYLTTSNGTFYFGCHLDAYAELPNGSSVTQGQIIGYNGDSGNAVGTTPHLHFEIHPGGGAAVNPKPILDRWLDEALANVATIVASYQQVGLPKPFTYAGSLRRFDEPLSGGNGVATLLAASSSNGGSRRLTELRASRTLASDSTKADAAVADAWKGADQTSRSLLERVTPSALQSVLVAHAD